MSKNRLDWTNQKDIGQLVTLLTQGNISIGTSDTVLGLLAPLSKSGLEGLNAIKGRKGKPYLILISNADSIRKFSDSKVYGSVERLINSCWPGPLTLIFNAKKSLPDFMKSKEGTVALRVPDHAGLQSVMKRVGPLFSTSANRKGYPTPTILNEVDQAILDNVDLVIEDKKIAQKEPVSSTILDCTGDEIKVVREGAYPIAVLETIASQRFIR